MVFRNFSSLLLIIFISFFCLETFSFEDNSENKEPSAGPASSLKINTPFEEETQKSLENTSEEMRKFREIIGLFTQQLMDLAQEIQNTKERDTSIPETFNSFLEKFNALKKTFKIPEELKKLDSKRFGRNTTDEEREKKAFCAVLETRIFKAYEDEFKESQKVLPQKVRDPYELEYTPAQNPEFNDGFYEGTSSLFFKNLPWATEAFQNHPEKILAHFRKTPTHLKQIKDLFWLPDTDNMWPVLPQELVLKIALSTLSSGSQTNHKDFINFLSVNKCYREAWESRGIFEYIKFLAEKNLSLFPNISPGIQNFNQNYIYLQAFQTGISLDALINKSFPFSKKDSLIKPLIGVSKCLLNDQLFRDAIYRPFFPNSPSRDFSDKILEIFHPAFLEHPVMRKSDEPPLNLYECIHLFRKIIILENILEDEKEAVSEALKAMTEYQNERNELENVLDFSEEKKDSSRKISPKREPHVGTMNQIKSFLYIAQELIRCNTMTSFYEKLDQRRNSFPKDKDFLNTAYMVFWEMMEKHFKDNPMGYFQHMNKLSEKNPYSPFLPNLFEEIRTTRARLLASASRSDNYKQEMEDYCEKKKKEMETMISDFKKELEDIKEKIEALERGDLKVFYASRNFKSKLVLEIMPYVSHEAVAKIFPPKK